MVNKKVRDTFMWFFDTSSKKGIPTNPETLKSITQLESKEEQNSLQQFIFQGDYLFIDKLESILEEHISDQKCKVKTISKDMALSYESLNNSLKRIKGCSLDQYFRSYRMNRAKILIEKSDKSISEICYYVGSSNLQSFSRSFKREIGISPRNLRKKKN